MNENDLYIVEEFDILMRFRSPYDIFYPIDFISKKKVAQIVLRKKIDEILLINEMGFQQDSVFAGLTEEHIEYIVKNGPRPYKENVLKIVQDKKMIEGAYEIVQDMDDDLGKGVSKNRERIRKVIQYIKDNRIVFDFDRQD